MGDTGAAFELPDELVDELCTRLGVGRPTDDAGVTALYDAWKAEVPFDPVAKILAVQEGRTPPGADPIDVCERFLTTGLGGTCWGQVALLAAVLGAAGVRASVAVDRMLVEHVDFHAFVVAALDGGDVVLDPIHATGRPLPFEAGASGAHGPYRSGFEAAGRRLQHWFVNPDRADLAVPYVVLATDLDRADVQAFSEIASRFSGVNARRLFLRRFPPDAMVKAGRADDGRLLRTTYTADGCTTTTHDEVDDVLRALGVSPAALDLAAQAGLVRVRGGRVELLVLDP